MIAAVELVLDKQRKAAASTPGAVGGIAAKLLQDRGVITRNMADALAICPPMIVSQGHVDELVGALAGMLEDLKPAVANLSPA